MECDKCGSCISVEEHHLHPRFMDNPDGKGTKIWLCKYCHDLLHKKLIPSVVWSHVHQFGEFHISWQTRGHCVEAVRRRTLQWLKEKE